MLIRVGYEITLSFPQPTAVVLTLHVHPSRNRSLRGPEEFEVEPQAEEHTVARQPISTSTR